MKKILSITLVFTLILFAFSFSSCTHDKQDTTLSVRIDLTEEWDKISEGNQLVQGCIVVRKEFAERYPKTVNDFLDEYKTSIQFTNSDPENAGNYIKEYGIFANNVVAAKAIPKCNIVYIEGNEMKSYMSSFLSSMYSVSPESIGSKVPSDDFYYSRLIGESKAENSVNISVLNGTTGFGIAQLMKKNDSNETSNKYNFKVETDPSVIVAGLINGSIDIAALPTNAASNIYNKTNGKIQILALNTLGVLYVVENGETVNSLSDLDGKTIYCPAQNPTFILQYILKEKNINATIDSTSYAEAGALKTAVETGKVSLAVLPEPMVTMAIEASLK